MNEKRKNVRQKCNIKAQFKYFEMAGEKIFSLKEAKEKTKAKKGKGTILDISQSGLAIITNSRLTINTPLVVIFKMKRRAHEIAGRVVRTGFLQNNPSEIAKKFLNFSSSADIYIAVQFEKLFQDGDL